MPFEGDPPFDHTTPPGCTSITLPPFPANPSRYMQELAQLPQLRNLCFKNSAVPAGALQWATNPPSQAYVIEAMYAYTRGYVAGNACTRSRLGYGVFPFSVVVGGMLINACADCHFKREGTHCDFHKDNRGLIREHGWPRISAKNVRQDFIDRAKVLKEEWIAQLPPGTARLSTFLVDEAISRIDEADTVLQAFVPIPKRRVEFSRIYKRHGYIDTSDPFYQVFAEHLDILIDLVENDPGGAGKAERIIVDKDLLKDLEEEHQQAYVHLQTHPAFKILTNDRRQLVVGKLREIFNRRYTFLVRLIFESKFRGRGEDYRFLRDKVFGLGADELLRLPEWTAEMKYPGFAYTFEMSSGQNTFTEHNKKVLEDLKLV